MNNERITKKQQFIQKCFGNKQLSIKALRSDASLRKYERVSFIDQGLILMDSPPEYYRVEDFINIAEFLSDKGFSAPKIYHQDIENGFLLLEDFGNLNIGQYLLQYSNYAVNKSTYQTIIDLLIKLQSIPIVIDLPHYTNQLMLRELEIYTDWYIPFAIGRPLSSLQKTEFLSLWNEMIESQHILNKSSMTLRDYHVENMMYLDRAGIESIGLLDFQDAVIGSPLHDLVSVLEDARIDVARSFAIECFDYYVQNAGLNYKDSWLVYHLLGAQRNSRILGVFARKAVRDAQEQYLRYIPRVLGYLEYNLSHEYLKPIAQWIKLTQ